MLEPKSFRGQAGNHEPIRDEPVVDIVRLKVILLEVIPPVWRRVQVPSSLTLRRLHSVLQCAMGWAETEGHLFRVGETVYGKTGAAEPRKDSRWVTVGNLAAIGASVFSYELGEADRWEHEIRIEGFAEGNHDNQRPICLAGERACPPPGIGGPDAYVELLSALKEPYRPGVATLSSAFDPERFDVESVNRLLTWPR